MQKLNLLMCPFLKRFCGIQVRTFPFTTSSHGKLVTAEDDISLHQKTENDCAHSVMERRQNYEGYLATVNQIHRSEKWDKWKTLLTPSENKEKITSVCENVSNLNDSEIEQLLVLLFQSERGLRLSEERKLILSALDEECIRRLKLWEIRTCLRMADYFFRLNLSRLSSYNSKMISHLTARLPKLSSSEFVQLLFYINVQRSFDSKLMSPIESKLSSCLHQLSTEEISIASLAFFKTQNSMQSLNLFKMIKQRFISDVDKLPSPTVTAFGKLFRATKFIDPLQFVEVLDKSLPHIAKWKPAACLHVGLITLAKQMEHEKYVKCMTLEVLNNLSDLTVKELRNLLTCVSTYDYQFDFAPDFYSLIIERLRQPEIQKQLLEHPLHLPLCLLELAYHEIFPIDLIKQALSPEFFKIVEDKMKYGWRREYLMLDSTVEIELPQYSGPRLNSKIKEKIWKVDAGRIPKINNTNLSAFEKTLLTIRYQLTDLLGSYDHANIVYILPHFKLPDVLVRLDENGNSVSSKSKISSFCHLPAEKTGKSICFSLIGRTAFSENTKKRMSHIKMKHRQLKMLGHHVVEIPWHDYIALREKGRRNYIKEKLHQATKL